MIFVSATFTGVENLVLLDCVNVENNFLFIMICVSLMDGLTENKTWSKPRADVHFGLKESQSFRGIVSMLV